ncbi:MAG: peptide chain release factor N(5)-glutamine methyltransferase [Pseudomonadota bacterium]
MPTFPDAAAALTVRRLLAWAADFFAAGNIDSPRLTAEILLAHSLNVPRIRLYTDPDLPLTPDERGRFKALLGRRMNREPVSYITGAREFWGLELRVTPDVLIPRPDTERLVEAVLEVLPETGEGGRRRILDLGTGSGAITVALASERPANRFVAMDRSLAALEVARDNARRHGVAQNIDFFQGDWLSAVTGRRPMFQVIVSNPPYIRADEWAGLDPEVCVHEPAVALCGGEDGLDAYRFILEDARRCILPGGYLFLEMGYRQRRDLEALAAAAGGFESIRCLADYAGHDRVLRLKVASTPAE